MSLKRKISSTLLSMDVKGTGPKLGVAAALGFVGILAGMPISEYLPMDDSAKPDMEEAETQYETALQLLSEYTPTAVSSEVPSGLGEILSINSESGAEQKEDARNTQAFRDLSGKFGASLIVDSRLNERQKYSLVQEFSSQIGNFETLTGLEEPDYADLDEATARVKISHDDYSSAKSIIERSWGGNRIVDVGKISAGSFAGSLLFMMLLSSGRRRLRSWSSETPYKKPSKFKH